MERVINLWKGEIAMPKFKTSKVGGSRKNRDSNYSTEKKFSFRSQDDAVERRKELLKKKEAKKDA